MLMNIFSIFIFNVFLKLYKIKDFLSLLGRIKLNHADFIVLCNHAT